MSDTKFDNAWKNARNCAARSMAVRDCADMNHHLRVLAAAHAEVVAERDIYKRAIELIRDEYDAGIADAFLDAAREPTETTGAVQLALDTEEATDDHETGTEE